MPSIIGILALIIIGYTVGSVRIINQGTEALVERLGRYNRKLKPGLNFIVPVLDYIVLRDSVREQILDVAKQGAITRDNVSLEVDAVVYWRILELELTFYAIENVEQAIQELVTTTLRSEIGKMEFEKTFSSRDELNRALLSQLDEATEPWGVKVTRVEVQEIIPPEEVRRSMQLQQAAELRSRAMVLEAQGEQEAAIKRAEATVRSIQMLSQALQNQGDTSEILNYLLAQRYVEANQRLGESENSKVVFMDPKMLTEGIVELMHTDTVTPKKDSDDFPSRRR
ncbi:MULTISPECIES: SPFH domain-containing protein [Cyanophyceae]|uniref:SPFH domain-containing protein n=1 Tax=Cyanophyceae TaxID=3028117 RepID=UPI001684DBA9|nr:MULTISPECIES: SPFH domain-containing protein [unclassified Phormidium]MBD1918624.1 paraslipin [Phormidium sp. FACHB-77]MBD2031101.1 paraslipin [Phormidium sp. FACHB-322]MBD2051087.1 paraslipin [Leptolyngbya sp. FACHB-60]